MARSRNIKPGFFRNEILADLEPLTRILFAGLWTIADRAGRLEDRPKRIKADVLPYDECDINSMLDALAEKSFIARYKYGTAQYIQILHFTEHQNPHKNEAESIIPPMPSTGGKSIPDGVEMDSNGHEKPVESTIREKSGTSTVQAPKPHSTNRADSLNTDSLNTDSGKGASAPQPKKRATQVPKDFALTDALMDWGAKEGFTLDQMRGQIPQFIDHWTGKGETRKDWVASFRTWMRSARTYGHLNRSPGSLSILPTGQPNPYAGRGYDPLRSLPPEELAEYERQLAEAKAKERQRELERRGA